MAPLKGRLPQFPISHGMQPAVEAYIRHGWINRDVRYDLTPILLRRGVVTDFDLTSLEKMARDPCYQEFLRPTI
jgi:hypothetical protein